MTLVLKSTTIIDSHSAIPQKGRIVSKDEEIELTATGGFHLWLYGHKEEYEREKSNWEKYDEDDETPIDEQHISYSYCGDKFDEWMTKKQDLWRKKYGEMYLNGKFDRETSRFPFSEINPDANPDEYVYCYVYTVFCRYETNGWVDDGVDDGDFETAEHLGILTPRNVIKDDDVDYLKMIDDEEQFMKDGDDFIDENQMIYEGEMRNCESLDYNDGFREFVEVRIESIGDNFAIGSLDGNKNVYIPLSVIEESESHSSLTADTINHNAINMLEKSSEYTIIDDIKNYNYNKRRVGEMCLMDIYFNESGKNLWKAVNIHPKYHNLKAEYSDSSNNVIKLVQLNKQSIGKVVGRSGANIKRQYNRISKTCPQVDEFWDGIDYDYYNDNSGAIKKEKFTYAPKFTFSQDGDYTNVSIKDWYSTKRDFDKKEKITTVCAFDALHGIVKGICF